jgi:chaperonin GroL
VTLGPRGRNVVLEQPLGTPQVINDGVSIARSIELLDPVENAGAQLVKEVAGKTNDLAGDGMTTASVIARELINLGLQAVTAGSNPLNIKSGIDKGCSCIVSELKEVSRPVDGCEDVKNVATISAGNDSVVGELIAEALDRVGSDGVLTIETSNSFQTSVEVQEGMNIDRGFISQQFITNKEKSIVEYDYCRVLVADEKIQDVQELIPILEQIAQANQPLLIVTEDITGEALATLVVNKMRGILQVVAVKAPAFGERRKSLLQDIAIITGAEYIAKDLGMKVSQSSLDFCGSARKVVVTSTNCTIIADEANREEIDLRIAQIKKDLHETDSLYDTEKLSERIAKLAGGVAVIRVGGFTEAEVEDRKLRIEDAKNSTFAAVEEGIVPGGGTALLHLSKKIPNFRETHEDNEIKLGIDIVMKGLRAPAKVIAQNAGVEGEVILESVLSQTSTTGYNSMENIIGDMYEQGIIDPTKVTRNAVQNSCSIAGLLLTTQAVMFSVPKARSMNRRTEEARSMNNLGASERQLPPGLTL